MKWEGKIGLSGNTRVVYYMDKFQSGTLLLERDESKVSQIYIHDYPSALQTSQK